MSDRPDHPPAETQEPPETEDTLGLPPTTGAEPADPSPAEARREPQGAPVPFAAPPTERDGGKFALRLVFGILGGGALIIAVVLGLVISYAVYVNSVFDQIHTTAEEFIADVDGERWDRAHDSLCSEMREDPVEHYVDEWRSWETDDAEVRSILQSSRGDAVPVRLGDGTTIELDVMLDQDGQSLDIAVCGWRTVG
ncbi:hypothetical protein [Glycomyces xiaoerkulensis]|uniref:hypothetical protein n=1 Tax=Glycomyces xiaoerkulensis TaxID=2038139 RepID=UPI000C2632F6|nr:hypothetical protein [Glycomyces xiaoerkulensis]